jgi:hypothetical protein
LKLEKTDLRTIETNDNAFDALIAALTARAIILGQTAGPQDHEDAAAAKVEGWIHVPSERFERLDPRL